MRFDSVIHLTPWHQRNFMCKNTYASATLFYGFFIFISSSNETVSLSDDRFVASRLCLTLSFQGRKKSTVGDFGDTVNIFGMSEADWELEKLLNHTEHGMFWLAHLGRDIWRHKLFCIFQADPSVLFISAKKCTNWTSAARGIVKFIGWRQDDCRLLRWQPILSMRISSHSLKVMLKRQKHGKMASYERDMYHSHSHGGKM